MLKLAVISFDSSKRKQGFRNFADNRTGLWFAWRKKTILRKGFSPIEATNQRETDIYPNGFYAE
jgi:hypothetical protein